MRKFQVGGMSCAACSARVEKAVSALGGIESCSVNLLTASMNVEGDVSDEDIIKTVEKAGYTAAIAGGVKKANTAEKSENGEAASILKRLIASAVILLILMYFSMGHMLGIPMPKALSGEPLALGFIQLLLSAAVLVINQKFFISGTRAAFLRAPNMDTLVALGSAASFGWSVYVLFKMIFKPEAASGYLHEMYFESAAMILVLITVGKMLESLAKGRTTNAIKSLMKLSPRTATVIRDGKEVEVPTEEVRIGDIFIVRPGANIPVDGEVTEGESAVDESMLTGESIPSEKSAGARVFAGTSNKSGYIKCRATSVGEETAIANIIKMVSDAAATKAPIAKIADKVSGIFVPFVLVVAIISGAVWLAVGQTLGFALERAISVLVISCPCALGLATPVAIMVGSGVGAKNGILFKNATAQEVSGRVKNIVLDKTGTITEGHPRVENLKLFGVLEAEFLTLAAALESGSEHPLAEAVVEYARQRGIPVCSAESFRAYAGGGVSGTVNGKALIGGSLKFVSEEVEISDEAREAYEAFAKEGKTPVLFASDGELIGIAAIRDAIKQGSPLAIAKMQKMGIRVTMLTGDNEISARAIASEVGVDDVIAGVLPEGKEQVIRELSKKGAVMMVGDGVNDAPALTRADVGVAIGSGTDVAIDSADVVITGNSLLGAVNAVRLGRAVLRNIKENLFWAFCYNIIGIPLAAGAFIAAFGWTLNPMFGAAAMSISSFLVVMNALRLNLIKLDFAPAEPSGTNEKETLKETVFAVKGMMCPHCEGRVKNALMAQRGVKSASASHENGEVRIRCESFVNDADLRSAIENEGYKIAD